MSIGAGSLRHRVQIEELVASRDSDGVLTESWQPFAEVWASIEPLSAREFIASGAGQSQIVARITVRYRAGLTPSMRIVHRGKTYNIAGVLPDKVSGLEYITLPVTEGVNQGQ
jgi:SPP1 family predicted phage head-tail adaptor